ncbi:hypothetical protein [Amycolatopsis sp. NPDC004378]
MMVQIIAVILASTGALGSAASVVWRWIARRGKPGEVQARFTGADGKERLLLAGGTDDVANDAVDTLGSMPARGDRAQISDAVDGLFDRQASFPAIEARRPRKELPGSPP